MSDAEAKQKCQEPYYGSDLFDMPIAGSELETAMDLANRYLEGVCTDDGRFQYRVHLHPEIRLETKYNILRHAGTIYAMASYGLHRPGRANPAVLRRAVGFLRRTALDGVPGRPGLSAVWSLPGKTDNVELAQAKLGGAGIGLLALVHVRSLLPGLVSMDILQRLAKFICFMQKSDGGFYSKYFLDSGDRSDNWTSLYYPGEASLGLLMLYLSDRNPRWLRAARHALEYLAQSRAGQGSAPPDHWALIASAQLLANCKIKVDRILLEHARSISGRLVGDLDQDIFGRHLHSCAVATRLEGLLASLDIAPKFGEGLHSSIIQAIQSGMRQLLGVQVRKGDYAGAIPYRGMEGHDDKSRNGEVRIDYVQHTLSALIEYHKRIDSLKTDIKPMMLKSKTELNRPLLEEALELGKRFLLNQQQPDGNFIYEYDWITRQREDSDSSVRQAGAAWSLALLYRHRPDEQLFDACRRSVEFFLKHSACTPEGARFVRYPGDEYGALGTVSLNALTLIDLLACGIDALDVEARYRRLLREYINFIERAVMDNGQWYGRYRLHDGEPYGDPSPYFDGESLLTFIRAAKRFDEYSWLKPRIMKAAATGFRCYILLALRRDPDSMVTKGYYQWASMAFYELATSGWDGMEEYADHVLYLADWMIDTHGVLDRSRNTAYAFEGLIHAYLLAKMRGDKLRTSRYRTAIHAGLSRLLGWQIGHSLANGFIRSHQQKAGDLGGVQNHATQSSLRVDVIQHQMHAVILSLNHLV